MFKALLKKQFLQIVYMAFQRGNKKKAGMGKGIVYALLLLYVGGVFFVLFFNMADSMCAPLLKGNLGWLYFAFMFIMAMSIGVIGSVFVTQSQLFHAKDNELLLAMPIPPGMILIVRVLALWVVTLVYVSLVVIPAYIAYVLTINANPELNRSFSALQFLFFVLLLILLTTLTQCISCILGWLVGLITSRTRSKNILTIVLSLVALAAYFYFVSQMNNLLAQFVENSEAIGAKMRRYVFVLYQMGRAACGEADAMLLSLAIIILIALVVYSVIAKTFLTVATTNKGTVKRVYKKKPLKSASLDQALFRKEVNRFFGTPVYLLNCGLGSVFLIIGAIIIIVKNQQFMELVNKLYPVGDTLLVLLFAAALCGLCGTDAVTAPSISLEGDTLWNLKCLPVRATSIFWAKLKLQLLVNGIPMLLCSVAILYVMKPGVFGGLLLLITPQIFNLCSGLLGLMVNLNHPNLSWASEVYAVKQSISVLITLFSAWGVLIALGIVYFIVHSFIQPAVFLLICSILLGGICALLWKWLSTEGEKRFYLL